jgi:ParB-like chromosome segregation protein Spo0J
MAAPPTSKRIELWPINRLKPYERNARTHSPEQVAQIAASIQEFGFTNPILVDGDDGILAGHGRLAAAKDMGLAEVPVVVLDHLTPTQRRAYILADNKLALNAGWDASLLQEEMVGLQLQDFDLDLLGFGEAELAGLLDPEGIDKPAKEYEGAEEYAEDKFSEFVHQCPRCGFEFNGKG